MISQEAVKMTAFTIPSRLVMSVNHAGVSSSHWRGELRIPNGCHIIKTICNVNYVIRNPHLSLCLQIRKSILSWNLYLIFIPKPGINPSASVYYKSRKVKTWTKQNIQKKRRRKSKGGGGRRERRRRNLNILEKRKNRKLIWRKSSKEPYRNISLFKALSPFTIYPELGLPWCSAINLPANAGDVGSIPGSGRSPGEGNATHSSILAWEIPWTKEPGGLQSMGSQRIEYGSASKTNATILWYHIC